MDKSHVQISLGSIDEVFGYVHCGFECLLVINGNIDVEIDGEKSKLTTDDIIVINSNKFYTLNGDRGNVILKLKVSKEYLAKECSDIFKYEIDCNSSKAKNSEDAKYFEIKRMLTQMLIIYLEKEDGYDLQFKSKFFEFIHTLFLKFRAERTNNIDIKEQDNRTLIQDIIIYINENYQKSLSLKILSDKVHMSEQYFSKLFKEEIGMGYLEYLTDVRLEHAVSDLIYTKDTILNIAIKNGFPNANSFRTAFNKKYNKTPREYREKQKRILSDNDDEKSYVFNVEISDGLLEFFRYVKRNDTIEENRNGKEISETIDLKDSLDKELKKPVKIINIENISSALKAETLKQLKYIQDRLDFQYVYFSIFDRENIFWENNSGLFKNYELYMVISSFYNYNLIPIFNIDYSILKSLESDEDLVDKFYYKFNDFLNYFSDKFPEKYINKWKFEISYRNEEDYDEFNKFYCELYRHMTPVVKEKNIGVLSIKKWSNDSKDNFKNSLKLFKENGCNPGFVSFYACPDNDLLSLIEKSNTSIENYYETLAKDIRKIIKDENMELPDIYMIKFNTLSGKNDIEVGTFFRSAIILDALLSVNNYIDGYGVNLSTFNSFNSIDKVEKIDTSVLGLFLYYKIKRPIFFIIEILNKLGRTIIFHDKGIIVTENEEGNLIIALYNPSYVNPSYSLDLAYIERESINKNLKINGMEDGLYQIKKFVFDKESGGPYSRWASAGYPDMLDIDVIDYLENAVVPEITLFDENIADSLSIHSKLSFNGIELYKVRKCEGIKKIN